MKTQLISDRFSGQSLRLQLAAALLSLAFWAACPVAALGQGVITNNSTSGANLDALFLPPTNSVTVNSGVTINNSGGGNYAVYGTNTWNLTNAATLNGSSVGVHFTAASTVNNLTNGIITGGTSDGVAMQSGGSVVNQNGGTIDGHNSGVYLAGAGSVINTGSITGTNFTLVSI